MIVLSGNRDDAVFMAGAAGHEAGVTAGGVLHVSAPNGCDRAGINNQVSGWVWGYLDIPPGTFYAVAA